MAVPFIIAINNQSRFIAKPRQTERVLDHIQKSAIAAKTHFCHFCCGFALDQQATGKF